MTSPLWTMACPVFFTTPPDAAFGNFLLLNSFGPNVNTALIHSALVILSLSIASTISSDPYILLYELEFNLFLDLFLYASATSLSTDLIFCFFSADLVNADWGELFIN